MNTPPPESNGWFESLRCIGESLLTMCRSRLELFTVELQEEKLRLISLLLWAGLAAALGFTGVFIALVTLALWLWTAAGYLGLIGLAVVTLIAAAAILQAIRKKIQTGPQPFANTVAEFRKDGECLRNHN